MASLDKFHVKGNDGYSNPPVAQPNAVSAPAESRLMPPIPNLPMNGALVERITALNWNQAELRQAMANGDKQAALEYEELYGPDKNSVEWPPIPADLPRAESITLPQCFPPLRGEFNLKNNLRGLMAWALLRFIDRYVIPEECPDIHFLAALYNPSAYDEGMECMAFFRKEVVLPVFGSVAAFHSFMMKFMQDLQRELYFMRREESITLEETLELFRAEGDLDTCKLIQLVAACYPMGDHVFHFLNNLAFHADNEGGWAHYEDY